MENKFENDALLAARIENARQSVEQAKANLAEAKTPEEVTIWQNRVQQREQELAELEAGDMEVAA